MIQESEKFCPRCGSPKLKTWAELNDEQLMLAKRLPDSAEFTTEERKQHCFCTQCWFEIRDLDTETYA